MNEFRHTTTEVVNAEFNVTGEVFSLHQAEHIAALSQGILRVIGLAVVAANTDNVDALCAMEPLFAKFAAKASRAASDPVYAVAVLLAETYGGRPRDYREAAAEYVADAMFDVGARFVGDGRVVFEFYGRLRDQDDFDHVNAIGEQAVRIMKEALRVVSINPCVFCALRVLFAKFVAKAERAIRDVDYAYRVMMADEFGGRPRDYRSETAEDDLPTPTLMALAEQLSAEAFAAFGAGRHGGSFGLTDRLPRPGAYAGSAYPR